MVTDPTSDAEFACPLCPGTLTSWSRQNLVVEFCEECTALFLDRGELYKMIRGEGVRCPPEALLRADFRPGAGDVLHCPKCRTQSLVPGAVEGCEVWHCTPCNGFLVERDHLLGMDVGEAHLEFSGFSRVGEDGNADARLAGYLSGMLRRVAFWIPTEERTTD
jgi:Zn-finger nucleic acid-binding protein